jgi:hypothetical protein
VTFVLKFSRLFSLREAEDGVVYEGNHRFEGYSLDLIDAISKILHFQYRFELVPDGEVYFCYFPCFFGLFAIGKILLSLSRQIRIVQQRNKAMGRAREAFIRQSKSLTTFFLTVKAPPLKEKLVKNQFSFFVNVYGFIVHPTKTTTKIQRY